MNLIRIYLSGSIAKNNGGAYPFWTHKEELILKKRFSINGVELDILNPNDPSYQEDTKEIYREELEFIENSSFILVEMSMRRGIGVGVEMYHANLNNVPVFTICPNKTYYKREDWVHPFVKQLSTKVFESLEEFIVYITSQNILKNYFIISD